jgi:hypothetical protein
VVGPLGFRLSVRRCRLPSGTWPAFGGQADGRRREVLAASSAPAKHGFQRGGAAQAVGDAGEDDSEIGGAEGYGEQGEAGGGSAALNRSGELPAVVDKFADDAEDAAESSGHGRAGPNRIGFRGWGGGLGRGGHEQNKNIRGGVMSRENIPTRTSSGKRPLQSRLVILNPEPLKSAFAEEAIDTIVRIGRASCIFHVSLGHKYNQALARPG